MRDNKSTLHAAEPLRLRLIDCVKRGTPDLEWKGMTPNCVAPENLAVGVKSLAHW